MVTKELEVHINGKVIKLPGDYVGNLFRVDSTSIDSHPMLTPREKKSLKVDLHDNKNIIFDE